MCAMMYHHKPSLPALGLALFVFICGVLFICDLRPQVESGEINSSSMAAAGFATCSVTGVFLIIAFARYRFTHLWRSTKAAHSDKYTRPHKKRRRRK
jgi:hypothetical protein